MQHLRGVLLLSVLGLLCSSGYSKENAAPPASVRPRPATTTNTPAATAKPAAPNASATPASTTPRPPEPAATAAPLPQESFALALQKVTDAEYEADFSEALRLARAMKEAYKGAEQQETINKLLPRLNAEKKESAPLTTALRNFLSGQAQYVDAAEEKFSESPETAGIMLRKALRTETDVNALLIAKRQIGLRDTNAIPIIVEQLRTRNSPALLEYLGYGVRTMQEQLNPGLIAACYQTFITRTNSARHDAASILELIFRTRCQGSTTAFNTLVQDPNGATTLRTFFEACLLSTNITDRQWGCEFGTAFAGLMSGARGQYYTDAEFGTLALTALDPLIRLENDKFPLPEKRQQNLSVRWTGQIDIPTEGDYTFVGTANPRGTLAINGQAILTSTDGKVTEGKIRLPAGLQALVVNYTQTTTPGPGIEIKWSGPGVPLQYLANNVLRTTPAPEFIPPLEAAIRNLTSTNWPDARTARDVLARAYQTGCIYLREALVNKSDEIAAAAAQQLLSQDDQRTPSLLLQRIEQAPRAPTMTSLTATLCDFSRRFDTPLLQRLQKAVQQDTNGAIPPQTAALCAFLMNGCTNDNATFNACLQDHGASAQLQAYLQRALISSNEESVIRACTYGTPFAPLLPGLRGRYFAGSQFDQLRLEQLTAALNFNQGYPAYPTKWEGEVSAQWTGFLQIDTPGTYDFFAMADSPIALWLDDKLVVTSKTWEELKGSLALTRGLHKLRAEFQWTGGNQRMQFSYSGPNTPKQLLGGSALRTPLWAENLAQLTRAVNTMASPNLPEKRAARFAVSAAGDGGALLLRNALRYKPDAVAQEAAQLLASLNDPETAALLITRIRQAPTSPVVPALLESLRELAAFIPAEPVVPLLENLAKDTTCQMTTDASLLCLVLDRTCQGQAERFNQLMNNPKAYELLRDYVSKARESRDEATLVRVACFGAPFVPPLPGWRGRYYAGQYFDALALEKLDGAIAVVNRQITLPGGQQDDLSVRWDGILPIRQAGTYTFRLEPSPQGELRIDGKPVQFDSRTLTNAMALSAGPHRLQTTLQQQSGNYSINLYWSGPGLPQQPLNASVMQTPVWQAEARRIPATIAKLTTTNLLEKRTARLALTSAGEYANIFLHQALRDQPDAIAKEVARILVDRNDSSAAALLLARLRKTPEAPSVPDLLNALRELAAYIPVEAVTPLLGSLAKDTACQMTTDACILGIVLERTCGGNAEKFNQLLQNAKAYDQFRAYVRTACEARDEAVLVRAACFGAPITPALPGLLGRYYGGVYFDTLLTERLDPTVGFYHTFTPPNRAEETSAKWSGTLLITQPGNYTFWQTANPSGELRIDGKQVVTSESRQQRTNLVNLTSGLHRIEATAKNPSGVPEISLAWTGPSIPTATAIPTSILRTPVWTADATGVIQAIAKLSSANLLERRAARSRLLTAGEYANIFLCHAIRYLPDATATEAAQLLTARNCDEAAPLLVARLRKTPDAPIVPALLECTRELVAAIPAETLPDLLTAVTADTKLAMPVEASLLCFVLDRTCNGRAEAFNQLLKNPQAYTTLKEYLGKVCDSRDATVLLRVACYGAPFINPVPGWQARYYAGQAFDELAVEKLDAAINLGNRQLTLPNNRQDDFSIRWNGILPITQAGTYTFWFSPNPQGEVRIDGKPVVFDSRTQSNAMALAAGPHRIQTTFQQQAGGYSISLSWSGPGMPKPTLLTAEALRTPIWPTEAQKLPAAIAKLTSTNFAILAEAKGALLASGEAGLLFLRSALREQADDVATRAAIILAEQNDPAAADLILQRVLALTDKTQARDLVNSLRRVARAVTPRHPSALLAAMQKDTKCAMVPEATALCAVFEATCLQNKAAFGNLTGNPKAADLLQAYVTTALTASDRNTIMLAMEFGSPFAPSLNGLQAQFYEGRQSARLAAERRDSQIAVPNRQFPLPGNRQDDIAARWTGSLSVTQTADYVFHLLADQGATLNLNGQNLMTSTGWTEQAVTNKLTAGTYPVRLDWWQSSGNARVELYWTPPGGTKKLLAGPALSAPMTRPEQEKLAALVDSLAAAYAQQLVGLTNQIAAYGASGSIFLRQALANSTNTNVIVRAAACLVGQRDARVGDLSCLRLQNEPKFPMARELVKVLRPAVNTISDEQIAWLAGFVAQDTQRAYPWHAGLLSLVWKEGCASSKEQLNARGKNPQAFDTLKRYSDAMSNLGTNAPATWTNEFRVVSP